MQGILGRALRPGDIQNDDQHCPPLIVEEHGARLTVDLTWARPYRAELTQRRWEHAEHRGHLLPPIRRMPERRCLAAAGVNDDIGRSMATSLSALPTPIASKNRRASSSRLLREASCESFRPILAR